MAVKPWKFPRASSVGFDKLGRPATCWPSDVNKDPGPPQGGPGFFRAKSFRLEREREARFKVCPRFRTVCLRFRTVCLRFRAVCLRFRAVCLRIRLLAQMWPIGAATFGLPSPQTCLGRGAGGEGRSASMICFSATRQASTAIGRNRGCRAELRALALSVTSDLSEIRARIHRRRRVGLVQKWSPSGSSRDRFSELVSRFMTVASPLTPSPSGLPGTSRYFPVLPGTSRCFPVLSGASPRSATASRCDLQPR
jgi:hypothetical protein